MKRMLCVASLSLLLSSLIAGCAAGSDQEPPQTTRRGRFRVSVESNGKPVADFNDKLVHRVELQPREVQRLFPKGRATPNLPFKAKKVFDSRGSVRGLKITGIKGAPAPSFGLVENDLVTAVGRRQAKSPDAFMQLFQDLEKDKQSSLTLERSGKPHKILFFSGNSAADEG